MLRVDGLKQSENMFNLESAIEDWRRQMAAGGIKSAATLDELESHLREDVQRRLQSAEPIQPAFESAVRQIGKPETLGPEFAEANKASPLRGWNWLVAACFAFPLICLSRRALVTTKLFGFWYWDWTTQDRVLGCTAVGLFVLAVGSWPFSHRFLPLIADRRKRITMIIACSAAGPLWFRFLPDFVLPLHAATGRFLVTMLWLMVPCVILPGVIYGLEQASRRAAPSSC
jgi:hypothetical protein